MTRKRSTDNEISITPAAPVRRKSSSRTRAKHSAGSGESVAPAVAPVAPAPDAVAVTGPAREEIALLAYTYWEARGCQGGSPEEDWLRAEQELRLRATAAAVA